MNFEFIMKKMILNESVQSELVNFETRLFGQMACKPLQLVPNYHFLLY